MSISGFFHTTQPSVTFVCEAGAKNIRKNNRKAHLAKQESMLLMKT